jgi:putative addiction module component (TIGR02574 family)
MQVAETDVISAALNLAPDARMRLVDRVLESLDADTGDFPMSPEWLAEKERRIATIDDGTAVLVPVREAIESIRRGVSI